MYNIEDKKRQIEKINKSFDIFINSGRKFACFVNLQIPDDYIIGKVKQINNAEICEIKRNPYSTYKTILHSKDESNY